MNAKWLKTIIFLNHNLFQNNTLTFAVLLTVTDRTRQEQNTKRVTELVWTDLAMGYFTQLLLAVLLYATSAASAGKLLN